MSLINRVFPSLVRDINHAFSSFEEPLFNIARRMPFASQFPVDITENEKSYTVEAEMPGMKREDISIDILDNNTLVLRGKVDQVRESGEEPSTSVEKAGEGAEATKEVVREATPRTVWARERSFGAFQRSFQFPGNIDPEGVKAKYENGILTVNIPKPDRKVSKVTIE
ncbi:uncharacterized protein VTP21DRAFT_2599 [Calcarisporiella thermophila]|uniref:uncharacterized protein n=1 Tax=Calcarisporiella thermophila TaxID=911321 RepID=UPI003743B197